jgi:hypothetical protein
MAPLSYRRHRFPPQVIQHAIWLYGTVETEPLLVSVLGSAFLAGL